MDTILPVVFLLFFPFDVFEIGTLPTSDISVLVDTFCTAIINFMHNSSVILSILSHWTVAMVTACLQKYGLFLTPRYIYAKVHIIQATAWVTACLLVPLHCNCSQTARSPGLTLQFTSTSMEHNNPCHQTFFHFHSLRGNFPIRACKLFGLTKRLLNLLAPYLILRGTEWVNVKWKLLFFPSGLFFYFYN